MKFMVVGRALINIENISEIVFKSNLLEIKTFNGGSHGSFSSEAENMYKKIIMFLEDDTRILFLFSFMEEK